jgi:hypothetical protein
MEIKIETLLKAKHLWNIVGGNEQKLTKTNVNARASYTKQENYVLNLIV